MATVLLVTYLLIVLALIAVILLQRSEGGGLGMGGGSSNGLMSVRGSANLLTRTTAILASLFFASAIGLTIMAELDRGTRDILQQAADGVGSGTSAPTSVLDALNQLQAGSDTSLPVPSTPAPTSEPVVPEAGADGSLSVPAAPTN